MSENIVVTGATSLIAQEVIKLLAARGAQFVLVGRNAEKLNLVATDARARGAARVESLCIDATDVVRMGQVLSEAEKLIGEISHVLVAQGELGDQTVLESDGAAIAHLYQVNVLSVLATLNPVAAVFQKRGRGTIGVISSVAGDRGRKSNYFYGSTKAALTTYTDGLRNRLSAYGVHVLTIKPGLVDTPMTAHLKKGALTATGASVAADIVKALDGKKDVLYTPWFWRPIMCIIKHLPECIFKRLSI